MQQKIDNNEELKELSQETFDDLLMQNNEYRKRAKQNPCFHCETLCYYCDEITEDEINEAEFVLEDMNLCYECYNELKEIRRSEGKINDSDD